MEKCIRDMCKKEKDERGNEKNKVQLSNNKKVRRNLQFMEFWVIM